VTYGPGYAVWERELGGLSTKMTAFVHPWLPVRVMLIEVRGDVRPGAQVKWFARLEMGGAGDGRFARTSREDGVIWLRAGTGALFALHRAFAAFPRPLGDGLRGGLPGRRLWRALRRGRPSLRRMAVPFKR
jgi:hypothetical protein